MARVSAELDQIKPVVRSHPDVLSAGWRVSAKAGRWEDCVKIARKMARSFPDWPVARVQLALSLYTLGRVRPAVAVLEKAIERLGESPLLTISLACCLGKLGKLDRARHIVEQAVEQLPDAIGLDRFLAPKVFDFDLGALWREDEGEEPAD